MNITNTLIKLRDDLREWVINNIKNLDTETKIKIIEIEERLKVLEDKINE